MTPIRLHPSAEEDLNRLSNHIKGMVFVILREMRDNPDLNDSLLSHDETVETGDSVSVNIQKWLSQYNQGRNLWRLKPINTLKGRPLPFRMFYAYKPYEQGIPASFWLLGVLPRGYVTYDEDGQYEQRIIRDYQSIDDIA